MGSWQISIGIAAQAAVLLLTALTMPPAGRARIAHLAYGFVVLALSAAAGWFWNMDYRVTRASRVAQRLEEGHLPPPARIEQALLFFENNKSLYPDTYARMRELVRVKGCIATVEDLDDARTMQCLRNQMELSIMFRGMLRAVSPPLEGGDGH